MEEPLVKETLDVKQKTSEYKNITKEELEGTIKERKLSVSYYTFALDDECAPVYDNLLSLLTESQMLISGASIYYDTGDFNVPGLIRCDELCKMLDNFDVIIIRSLDYLLSTLEEELLRFLVDMRSEKKLYIIDYENKNFTEINIDLLLYHYFEEIRDPEMICDDFAEISRKYYDGKLLK